MPVHKAAVAAAHSSRAAVFPDPRPVIKAQALPAAPEPRQTETRSGEFAARRKRANYINALVDGASDFVAAQRRDDPLDVAPVAEASDIAVVAAALGARGRLEEGLVTEAVDQVGGVRERKPAVDEGRVHARSLAARRFATADKYRQHVIDHVSGGFGGAAMSDVFVSYKAEDKRRVKPLVDALEADGYSVWWDEQIGGGATWRRAIEAELNSASCVIVAWSKRSVGEEGTFVQDEATRAQQRHVYVPVLIDKVHLPLGFGETQALPLSAWKGDRSDARYQAVLAAVQRIAGDASGGGTSLPRSRKQPHVDRRAVLAGGAVATVAVVVGGGWALLKPSSASAASDSIAVLPFANLSGDPNQAYFSDGIAEEIRSALARLAGLKVVGRTSSEAVRNDDAESAAKKLEVANILTGSVRQSPSTIRISAELIDGKTGMDRWSQDYDRSPGDSIKIQTDIAENVASALSTALGEAAKAAVTVGGTDNPNAQMLLIQAIALENGPNSREAVERAIDLTGSAIRLDPNYADAYARKAVLLVRWGNNYGTTPAALAQSRGEALSLAQKALRIAPDLAQAHRALFSVYGSNLQMAPAVAELTRARALAPGDADTLATYGRYLARMRRFDEALHAIDQAMASDPLNGFAYEIRTTTLFYARRYRDAAAFAKQVEAKSPELAPDPVLVGDTLVALGNFSDAQAQYSKAAPDYWGRVTGEALLAARQGNKPASLQKLERLRQLFGDAGSTQLAEIYAQLGDREAALSALERAYEVKDAGLSSMLVDPWLDPVRKEPRFVAIVRKMSFPA